MQGLSKGILSLSNHPSQGPCKDQAREGLSKAFFHRPIILLKGSAKEGFNKCSSSSFNQPDAVSDTSSADGWNKKCQLECGRLEYARQPGVLWGDDYSLEGAGSDG